MSLLLSCLDDFSTISPLKSIFWTVVFTSPCPCWTSASLAAAFFCTVLLLVFRLVSVAVLWLVFCLLLALLLCLLLALLLSVLSVIAPDFSCSSRCPRTRVALLHSCRHRLVGCGSVSDSHRSLAVVPSVLLSHHWLFGCGAVCAFLLARFWLPPKITTQHCALRD